MTAEKHEPQGTDRGAGTSRWADLGGPVHFVDFGGPADGPVVVCVHGLGGSYVNWLAIGPRLAQTCRVYALDLAGHGRTPADGRGAGVTSNQRLLHRFLREVTGAPAILVGNSMGGMVSILQADADPSTVSGLVLVDPVLPLARGQALDREVALAFAIYALPGIGESFLARRSAVAPEQVVREVLALCCVDPSRVPPDVLDESLALAHERAELPPRERNSAFLAAARSLLWVNARAHDYRAKLRRIRVPVLLLHGEKDRLVRLAAARATAAANPHWRFEVAPDTGHVPQLESPDWTFATILDWVETEGRPAVEAARSARSVGSPAA